MVRFIGVLLLGLMVAQPLRALTISATYSGTVISGFDQNGEFGFGSDAVLDGQDATLVFIYDTALPYRITGVDFDAIFSGLDYGTSPTILSFGATINGVTLWGAPTNRANVFIGENGPISEVQHWADDNLTTDQNYHQYLAMAWGVGTFGDFSQQSR